MKLVVSPLVFKVDGDNFVVDMPMKCGSKSDFAQVVGFVVGSRVAITSFDVPEFAQRRGYGRMILNAIKSKYPRKKLTTITERTEVGEAFFSAMGVVDGTFSD